MMNQQLLAHTSLVAIAGLVLTAGSVSTAHAIPNEADAARATARSGHVTLARGTQSFDIDVLGTASKPSTSVVDDGIGAVISDTMTSNDQQLIYRLRLPADTSPTTVSDDDGNESIILTATGGDFAGGIAPIDSVDANGDHVATSVHVDGQHIVQEIDDTRADIAFPVRLGVTASTVWYKRAWVGSAMKGYIVNADPTSLGRQQIANPIDCCNRIK